MTAAAHDVARCGGACTEARGPRGIPSPWGAVFLLALCAARPPGPFSLELQRNGQAERWTMPDGGRSGLFAGSGQACAPLGTVTGSVLLIVPEGPVNLCMRPSSASPSWDGGCNTIDGDENFGVPLQPWVEKVVVVENATHVCAASDAGVVRVPLWMKR